MENEEILRLKEIILTQSLENQRLLEQIEILKREQKELEEKLKLANKDKLTGLYNREIVEEAYLNTGTIVMCDIDDFKKLNDNYGHNFGDIILKNISDILVGSVRNTDYVIRWGGEEFIIFVDNNDITIAKKLAERIRTRVETLEGQTLEDGSICPKITMSFGVSKLHSSDSMTDEIKKADDALYESKRNGKDRVTVYGEDIEISDNKTR